jgi:hypothetical protein
MAQGLLGGVLPAIYSGADQLKRGVYGLLTDPMEQARRAGQSLLQSSAERQALMGRAFANPERPFQVTDQAALGQLGSDVLMGELGIAPVGMFIGQGSKLWKPEQAFKAAKLEKQGKAPEEIWKETGTVRAADGNWRQEISDKEAFALMKPQSGNMEFLEKFSQELYGVPYGRLPFKGIGLGKERQAVIKLTDEEMNKFNKVGTSLEHPELYKSYDDLKNIDLYQGFAPDRSGSYVENRGNPYITMNAPNEPELRSGLLHELQHGIQVKEGWARGGSPEEFLQPNKEQINEVAKKLNELSLARKEGTPEYLETESMFNKLRSENPSKTYDEAMEIYKRLLGEAEARLTQGRMDLTPEQRLEYFPYNQGQYGLDVPLNELIVKGLLER